MSDQAYVGIARAVDAGIQGAPKAGGELSPAFIAYLKLVYTPAEAELVQHLTMPAKFKSSAELAAAAGRDPAEVQEILAAALARRCLVGAGDMFCLPAVPMLLNYHHLYPEVKPDDLEAARLYRQFFIKEGYYRYYEGSEKGTPVMRVIPVEQSIDGEQQVLSAEEAHAVLQNLATDELALVPCPCRTRTEKMGDRECRDRNPVGSCIFIGMPAALFKANGLGRAVTKAEAIRYFDQMQELGLVATTENYLSPDPTIICLCCECCCSQVRGRTRWDNPDALLPSNFVPRATEECLMCGTCEDRCFFGALSVDEEAGRVVADPEKCVGCGVCTLACPQDALKLHRYERTQAFPTSRDLYKTIAAENKGR
jgi:ferredoxin